jgi:hypothetical protein
MDPSNLPVKAAEHMPQNFWEFLHEDGGPLFMIFLVTLILVGCYKLIVKGFIQP